MTLSPVVRTALAGGGCGVAAAILPKGVSEVLVPLLLVGTFLVFVFDTDELHRLLGWRGHDSMSWREFYAKYLPAYAVRLVSWFAAVAAGFALAHGVQALLGRG